MPKKHIEQEIRSLGIGLLIIGIVHIIASGLFSFYWGFILIFFGIFSIFYKKIAVYLIFGILILLAGLSNLVGGLFSNVLFGEGFGGYFWFIFGGFQIYWGASEIIKYTKIKSMLESRKREKAKLKN